MVSQENTRGRGRTKPTNPEKKEEVVAVAVSAEEEEEEAPAPAAAAAAAAPAAAAPGQWSWTAGGGGAAKPFCPVVPAAEPVAPTAWGDDEAEPFDAAKAPAEVVRARTASIETIGGPCGHFQLDLLAGFGTCKCGFKKSEHEASALLPTAVKKANPFSKANYVPAVPSAASKAPPAPRHLGGSGKSFTPGDKSSPAHKRVHTVPKADGDELAATLARREKINAGEISASDIERKRPFNPYTEFEEFSRKECRDMIKMFKTYDLSKDGFISLEELKKMMEKLGDPQTHTALKGMVREVDEDGDGSISQREFFMIFRKARNGTLQIDGLKTIVAQAVDVSEVGVGGAKNFFEAKAAELTKGKAFEMEIKAEQEAKKAEAQAARERKEAFKARQAMFKK